MNGPRRPWLLPGLAFLSLALAFFALEPTPIEVKVGQLPLDLWIQDHFYDPVARHWWLDKNAAPWNWIFYKGALYVLYAHAAAIGLLLAVPKRKWNDKGLAGAWFADPANLLFLLACFLLIPAFVSLSKNLTDIYVPADTARYFGGKMAPHVRVLEHYPADFLARRAAEHISPGKSFPAGHCTGGFALLAYAFVLPRHWKWLGAALGLGLGWTLGAYKMVIGDHYFSHTLITCLFAWTLCSALAAARDRWRKKHSGPGPAGVSSGV